MQKKVDREGRRGTGMDTWTDFPVRIRGILLLAITAIFLVAVLYIMDNNVLAWVEQHESEILTADPSAISCKWTEFALQKKMTIAAKIYNNYQCREDLLYGGICIVVLLFLLSGLIGIWRRII